MANKAIRILLVLLGLALIHATEHPAAFAQDNYRAKATKVTVTEPMQLPGTVLAPGEYVFRLNDSDSNRHIVEVWDKDQTKLVTRVLAIANSRMETNRNDKGLMTYAERPSGQPVALEAWFYAGEKDGQQFVYPKTRAAELSRLNKTEVPSTGSEEAFPGENRQETATARQPTQREERNSESAPSPAATSSSRTTEPVYSASAQTPSEPQGRARTNSAPDQQYDNSNAAKPSRLPDTASPLPLLVILGTMLITAAVLLKLFVRG